MIKLQGKLSRKLFVACSGGVDSMVALDFLKRNHDVTVLHFNHGTEHGRQAEEFVSKYCRNNNIKYIRSDIGKNTVPLGASREAWWREKRYAFFDKYSDYPIVTGHHLDDCVETWIWSCLNGTGKIIPYRRNHVIRPFRLNRKRDLELWAALKQVPFIEDTSNEDIHYTRNYIRHKLMDNALIVNPGLHKTIARKVKDDER
jgi:tRNA(Ile)-lysidine synthase|tara:strand:- start:69 stop:671 length:603 start_codon:yes stop_codon:yes gene_type:complete